MTYRVAIEFPPRFVRFNSVQPDPVLGADGWWYFVVYGHPDGESESKQYLFRWRPNAVAKLVELPAETNARGSIGVHAAGAALFSWEGSGSDPQLICQEIADFTPAPLDSRVDALLERVGRLETHASAAGLSAQDVEALRRLRALCGLE